MSGYYNRNNRGITKKLGPVTAYADAVLAGYKGTREQWAQDMAKLGQNVTQVAQNTELTTELAEQTRENTEQVAKDTADVRRLADETSDNAVQVASNTEESNRLAKETKQAAAQAKADAEYAGAAADNFRVDTTLSEEGKAAEAKTTGEKFAQLSEENDEVKNVLIQSNLEERHLVFLNGSFVNVGGSFVVDTPAKNTGYVPVFGYNRYKIHTTISDDGCSVAFYDVKKQFLSDSKIVGSYNGIGVIPDNAYYVVFSSYGENNESAYLYKLNATEENHNARLTELEDTIEWTPNLYNKNDGVENGYYWNNVFYPSDDYYTVTIRVRNGVKKIKSYYTNGYVSYYNQKGDLIGGDDNIDGYNQIINIPNDCYFVKITSYRAAISPNGYTCYDVTNGDVTTPVPYGYNLKNCLSIINSNSKLIGKKIMFFGDSITESGYMYRSPLVRNTGMIEVACFAVSGATIRNHDDTVMDGNPTFENNNTVPNQVQKLLNNISSYEAPDIIVISASTNDWATGNEYDESQFTNESGFIDVDTLNLKQNFTGCMRWMYEKLMEVYPNAKVFFATPLQSTVTDRDYTTQKQKRNCIVSVCNRMSCQYIDAFYNSGVYDVNASMYLADGLHPHEAGGELIAKCYENELTNKYF